VNNVYNYLVKLKVQMLPLSCYKNKLQNLSHFRYGFQIRQLWMQLITACGDYCEIRCTKHASLIWTYIDDAIDEWLPQWWHDPAWPTPFSVAVSVRPDQWCVFWTSMMSS